MKYKSYNKNCVQPILLGEGTEPGTILYSTSFQSVHACNCFCRLLIYYERELDTGPKDGAESLD